MITTLKQKYAFIFLCTAATTATTFAMEERFLQVTVTNLLPHTIGIRHTIWHTCNSMGIGCDHIKRNKSRSLLIASNEGKPYLSFYLYDYNSKEIRLNLEKDQKNITIKQSPNAVNEVIIEDETKQLAQTFILLNEQ